MQTLSENGRKYTPGGVKYVQRMFYNIDTRMPDPAAKSWIKSWYQGSGEQDTSLLCPGGIPCFPLDSVATFSMATLLSILRDGYRTMSTLGVRDGENRS